jgi:hypothetical protein
LHFPLIDLLGELRVRLPLLLGRNFVGLYLHGSLTLDAFAERRSDVDAIVVTRRVLTTRQFRTVGRWLRRSARTNRWTRRLQMTFLQRSSVLTMNAAACLYQFGRLTRSRSDGNPIIWLNVLESGVTLAGPPARSFVPSITIGMLHEALERELGYLRGEITTKPRSDWRNKRSYRVYAMLTVCRILHSFRTRAIVSKTAAARWAIEHVPSRHRALVRRVLRAHRGGVIAMPALSEIRGFIAYAEIELQIRPRRRFGAGPHSAQS